MDEKNGENLIIGQHEQERIKMVHTTFTAYEQGNLQEFLTPFTDDVEWRVAMPEELPIGGTFHGLKGVQTFFENHKKMFDGVQDERFETVAQGNRVAVIGRERAHIRPHNKIYEGDYITVFHFRGRKISKVSILADSAALLKAYRGE
ncbi:MAG: hypothetical protein DRR08_06985 [Candidatus Parabeggiatoa sp. nov. 2]|nr:MAG: hypothetical protein B6247_13905 [Beggiatoa sp. 4572_84]RKZ62103.1 MAG: hypothetical protein DRR08_06985 [Gammaproteobacteria bacterium]HEC84336.1 hypothetical protein [Thioploca sp.]